MRKVSLILAVLLFAAPALATVGIDCEWVVIDNGPSAASELTNEVVVKYKVAEDEPHKVRAFALDITISNGVILDVDDSINPYYTIYPGSIVIEDGVVVDDGNAVADPCDLPGDTKGGIGTNAITIEMGALYAPPEDSSPNAPPDQNNTEWHDLISFTFGGGTVTPVEDPQLHQGFYTMITIEENESRGGIVMTGSDPIDVNMPTAKPLCKCCSRQCHGDADCANQLVSKPYFWVTNNDLLILIDGYVLFYSGDPGVDGSGDGFDDDSDPDTWICADFDHKKQLVSKPWYHVTNNDLLILTANYVGGPTSDTSVPPGDCVGVDCQ